MNLFIGTEAEGPNQGKQTLFIPNTINEHPLEKIMNAIEQYSVECVYFGAGNHRGISLPLLSNLFKLPRTLIVTVECNRMGQVAKLKPYFKYAKDYFNAFHIVFVIDVEDLSFFQSVTDIKFVDNEQLVWIPIQQVYTTQLNNVEYVKDREV